MGDVAGLPGLPRWLEPVPLPPGRRIVLGVDSLYRLRHAGERWQRRDRRVQRAERYRLVRPADRVAGGPDRAAVSKLIGGAGPVAVRRPDELPNVLDRRSARR